MRARASIVTVIAAAAAIAASASSAYAAPANIIAGAGGADPNLFSAAAYTHDAGTVATMTWVAGGAHNVTGTANGPDNRPILDSQTISSGSTPVPGSQYLPIGTYPFVCTIHFGMNSTLNVNVGTPQPRPTVAAKLVSKKLAKVAKKGKAVVKVTLTGTEPATVALKLGKRTLGSNDTTKSGKVAIRISKQGKNVLKKKKKVKLSVAATVAFGSPATSKGKLK